MNIEKILKDAKDIGCWLHQKINKVDIPNKKREVIAVSLFQQVLDVADGIIVLLENNLSGPAWSLARPMHEGYVRAVWILNHASEKNVSQFIKGRCPKFPVLIKDIGDEPETGGYWIKAMTELNIKAFHDFMHGGIEHVVRRMGENSIEPNYSEEEIINLVKVRNQYCINIVVYLPGLIGDEEGLENLNEKRVEWQESL
jgi:hypothetical protein